MRKRGILLSLMVFIPREEAFICAHCQGKVHPLGKGTYRNHCPHCLWSKHVDEEGPGDRGSDCQGLMRPVSVEQKHGQWVIIHCCEECKKKSRNKAAPDDSSEVVRGVMREG